MNRRDLLKLAAGAPLLKCLDCFSAYGVEANQEVSPADSYGGAVTLSILLHGMFAIEFKEDTNPPKVILYPPHVERGTPHAYLASDLAGSPKKFVTLDRNSSYSFNFAGASARPAFSEFENAVVILKKGKIERSNVPAHCQIELPMPDYLVPLRSVAPLDPSQNLFEQSGALIRPPSRLPLITMLRYIVCPNSLGFNLGMKYHFFAEPEVCPADFHSAEALSRLKDLYTGLTDKNLLFNKCLGPSDLQPLPEPMGIGIDLDDERALVEINHPTPGCIDLHPCTHSETKAQQYLIPQEHPKHSKSPKLLTPHKKDGPEPSGDIGIHPTACMSVIFVPS